MLSINPNKALPTGSSLRRIRSALTRERGLTLTHRLELPDGAIYLDVPSRVACLVVPGERARSFLPFLVQPHEVLSAEILVDEESVSRVSTSSLVGRALVGALLFRQTGALLGGLSAAVRSESMVSRIQLRLLARGASARLTFFQSPRPTRTSTATVKTALGEVRRWRALMGHFAIGAELPLCSGVEALEDSLQANLMALRNGAP